MLIINPPGLTAIPKTAPYGTSKHALHGKKCTIEIKVALIIIVIIGFFKALNQEFILTNTPISISIMPLPYVLTKKVCAWNNCPFRFLLLKLMIQAVDNWKPIGTGDGITPEV